MCRHQQRHLLTKYFEREKQRIVIQFLKLKDKGLNDLVLQVQKMPDSIRDKMLMKYYKACRAKYVD